MGKGEWWVVALVLWMSCPSSISDSSSIMSPRRPGSQSACLSFHVSHWMPHSMDMDQYPLFPSVSPKKVVAADQCGIQQAALQR